MSTEIETFQGNEPTANIALFVDMENLIRTALDIALPIDLAPIIAKLLEHGRISVRRGFGDLDAACRGDWQLRMRIRKMIHENLVQFEDIPYITKHKNASDMRLTVEALSIGYTHPDISHFAIVAADRDYAPLIAKLKELGKHVIGIGTSPDTVNEIYVKSCDIFLYYSTMFEAAATPPPQEEDTSILDSYVQLLCQAAAAVLQRGGKPIGATIMALMRQLKPDFDPRLAGMRSFKDIAMAAERSGLVKTSRHGNDLYVSLTSDADQILKTASARQRMDLSDLEKSSMMYTRFFEDKLKCPIPKAATRKLIYDIAVKILETELGEGNTPDLSSLSKSVERVMEDTGKTVETSVFKVLYAIFRAEAFEYEIGDQPYNPRIRKIVIPPDEWDAAFVWNCLLVMRKERRRWPIMEVPLADIFETTPEEIKRLTSNNDECDE